MKELYDVTYKILISGNTVPIYFISSFLEAILLMLLSVIPTVSITISTLLTKNKAGNGLIFLKF